MLKADLRLAEFMRANQNPYDKGLIMPLDGMPTAGVKDIDGKKGIVRGYYSSFGVIDSWREVLVKGAFTKTVMEWGPKGKRRIKHLLHHVPYWGAGVIQELEEDNFGLLFTTKMMNHERGRDTLIEYEEGHFTEHSIGFRIIKWEWDDENDVLLLIEVQLYEGSSVAWGANPETPVVDIKALREDPSALDGLVSKVHAIKRCLSREITDERAVELETELASLRTLVSQWEIALRSELGLHPDEEPSLVDLANGTSEELEPLITAQVALQIAKQLNLEC